MKSKKVDICDGCGWKKKIVFVNEYGEGFCEGCMREAINLEGDE